MDCKTRKVGKVVLATKEEIEKQGEQKPNKVEPKFHEGEWITNGNYTWKIVEVKPLDYILQSQDGNIVDDTISHVDEQFHSFTIEDAKDGDVLFYRGNVNYSDGIKFDRILLFENLDKSFFVLTKYSNGVEDYGIDVNIDYPNNIVLATKEQKEILFMAMTDAGYTFDFERKELKKIEQKSEIDQYSLPVSDDSSLPTFDESIYHPCTEKAYEQNPSEWSEEDEAVLDALIRRLKGEDVYVSPHLAVKCLKSLKDRVQLQPKQEWSEEDGKILNSLISSLARIGASTRTDSTSINYTFSKEIDWLKSLRPQNTWKPSDEQMDALRYVTNFDYGGHKATLVSLYEQLKKLKG